MMNYCAKIKYSLYTAVSGSFEEMVTALLERISVSEIPVRLVFFDAPADNGMYVCRRDNLLALVHKQFPANCPVVSYVAQPPLGAGLVMEVHALQADPDDSLSYRNHEGFPYVVLDNADGHFLFAGGFHADVKSQTHYEQSVVVFSLIQGLLEKEGVPVHGIVRQWNYIEQITGCTGVDQHYQMFNNARSDFYAGTSWADGYPAATGIGACCGGVLVDLDAAVFNRDGCFVTPIDNKLQVAAHAYSDQVLVAADRQKKTPKFERAKSMTFDSRRLVYISGTAAIRGEERLTGVGLARQFQITMENIAQLTGEARLCLLRIYLKEPCFYEEVRQLVDELGLTIPVVYLWANVCREELLIEIEGIAVE